MTDEPALFTLRVNDRRQYQCCDLCGEVTWTSDEALRVRGWLVFDGASLTGKTLHVRVCPACQPKGSRS